MESNLTVCGPCPAYKFVTKLGERAFRQYVVRTVSNRFAYHAAFTAVCVIHNRDSGHSRRLPSTVLFVVIKSNIFRKYVTVGEYVTCQKGKVEVVGFFFIFHAETKSVRLIFHHVNVSHRCFHILAVYFHKVRQVRFLQFIVRQRSLFRRCSFYNILIKRNVKVEEFLCVMEEVSRLIAYAFFRRIQHAFAHCPVVNVLKRFYNTLAGHTIVFKFNDKVLTDEVVFAKRSDIEVRGQTTVACTGTHGETTAKQSFPFRKRFTVNFQYVLQTFQVRNARCEAFAVITCNKRRRFRTVRKPHLQEVGVIYFQFKCRMAKFKGLVLIYVTITCCRTVAIEEIAKR